MESLTVLQLLSNLPRLRKTPDAFDDTSTNTSGSVGQSLIPIGLGSATYRSASAEEREHRSYVHASHLTMADLPRSLQRTLERTRKGRGMINGDSIARDLPAIGSLDGWLGLRVYIQRLANKMRVHQAAAVGMDSWLLDNEREHQNKFTLFSGGQNNRDFAPAGYVIPDPPRTAEFVIAQTKLVRAIFKGIPTDIPSIKAHPDVVQGRIPKRTNPGWPWFRYSDDIQLVNFLTSCLHSDRPYDQYANEVKLPDRLKKPFLVTTERRKPTSFDKEIPVYRFSDEGFEIDGYYKGSVEAGRTAYMGIRFCNLIMAPYIKYYSSIIKGTTRFHPRGWIHHPANILNKSSHVIPNTPEAMSTHFTAELKLSHDTSAKLGATLAHKARKRVLAPVFQIDFKGFDSTVCAPFSRNFGAILGALFGEEVQEAFKAGNECEIFSSPVLPSSTALVFTSDGSVVKSGGQATSDQGTTTNGTAEVLVRQRLQQLHIDESISRFISGYYGVTIAGDDKAGRYTHDEMRESIPLYGDYGFTIRGGRGAVMLQRCYMDNWLGQIVGFCRPIFRCLQNTYSSEYGPAPIEVDATALLMSIDGVHLHPYWSDIAELLLRGRNGRRMYDTIAQVESVSKTELGSRSSLSEERLKKFKLWFSNLTSRLGDHPYGDFINSILAVFGSELSVSTMHVYGSFSIDGPFPFMLKHHMYRDVLRGVSKLADFENAFQVTAEDMNKEIQFLELVRTDLINQIQGIETFDDLFEEATRGY